MWWGVAGLWSSTLTSLLHVNKMHAPHRPTNALIPFLSLNRQATWASASSRVSDDAAKAIVVPQGRNMHANATTAIQAPSTPCWSPMLGAPPRRECCHPRCEQDWQLANDSLQLPCGSQLSWSCRTILPHRSSTSLGSIMAIVLCTSRHCSRTGSVLPAQITSGAGDLSGRALPGRAL